VEEPLIYREEVTAILIALADIVTELRKIRRELENGEEEEELGQ
jgi:ATP:corrinoid adenosyltransferase